MVKAACDAADPRAAGHSSRSLPRLVPCIDASGHAHRPPELPMCVEPQPGNAPVVGRDEHVVAPGCHGQQRRRGWRRRRATCSPGSTPRGVSWSRRRTPPKLDVLLQPRPFLQVYPT